MKRNDLAVLKGLVSVAWADGVFVEREKHIITALLNAFGASAEVIAQLDDYAAEPRKLDDIPVDEMSEPDRRILLQHAVLLAMIDGDYDDRERSFIERLRQLLDIPTGEAAEIYADAEKRAGQMLQLL